jgi:hypothetical protein
MEENPKINRVLTKKGNFNIQADLDLEEIAEGELITVEITQVVPNPANTKNDFLSLGFRLQGHEKAIEIKENKTLNVWLQLTKQAFEKTEWEIGDEIENYTLKEEYIPFNQLSTTTNSLDKEGNVTINPVINPFGNELLLYPVPTSNTDGEILKVDEYPMFRYVYMTKGTYTPVVKPNYTNSVPMFEGKVKGADNRKTKEYQKWLNGFVPKKTNKMKPTVIEELELTTVQAEA